MEFIKPFFEGKSVFKQILFLILFLMAGAIVFSGLGELIAYAVYHTMDMYEASSPAGYARIVQVFSSLGMFFAPALLFAYCQDKQWWNYEHANRKPHYLLTNVTLVLSIVLLPLVAILDQWNSAIRLPESMAGIQQWMDSMEEQAESLMTLMTFEHNNLTLVVNLLVLALIPALGEEFLFRGTIQNAMHRWTGKPHLAIWVTAFIFSAIHFQFAGFIPRMLLGAYLGYLFYWSKSIWLPVMAHCLHNALTVLVSFTLQGRGILVDEIKFTDIHGSTTMVITCAVVAAMSIVFMWRTQKELNA